MHQHLTLEQLAGRASYLAWSAIIGFSCVGALIGQALARRLLPHPR